MAEILEKSATNFEENARLMRRATVAAVAVAVLLVFVKMVAWWLTDSVSLLSSLVDSMLDVGASFVNLLAVRHALQPADYEHRFGHGKAEHLAEREYVSDLNDLLAAGDVDIEELVVGTQWMLSIEHNVAGYMKAPEAQQIAIWEDPGL